jgi:hypothetical protein
MEDTDRGLIEEVSFHVPEGAEENRDKLQSA